VADISWPDFDLPPINQLSLGRENSPCQKKCELKGEKCTGCLRTIEEITCWSIYDPHEMLQILSRIYKEDPTIFTRK
jgi:predicted Fe-S protein YdhL (DUF1289 family)